MQVSILGPLEVRVDGEPVDIAGPMVRALLVRLALDPGRAVGATTLIDDLWGDDAPADATNALQTLVSRLRRNLGADAVQRTSAGYRLDVTPDDVDVHRFEQFAAQGTAALRRGEHRPAAAILTDALALWRGPALADVADAEFALAPSVRLGELHVAATLDRIEADLALGQPGRAVSELEALAAERPLHERLALLHMRALAAAGRPADALAAFERLRTRLADELGTDPSADLKAEHVAILRGEAASRRAPAHHTNLRVALTTFIGRDAELTRLDSLLAASRLVTIVGPGGAGKTRLVSEAARRWVDAVSDGVWFVALAPVDVPEEIVPSILSALGLREGPALEARTSERAPRDPWDRLLDALGDRDAVVILDNCEHLVAGAAEVADRLLQRCPRLRIAATSREPLGILGEALCVIPPLPWPEQAVTPQEALAFPAIRLFAERAAAVQPEFTLDGDTLPAVVEIARRLDGLPLALELAAARLRTLPVTEIAARLSDRFRLLTGGSRTAMPRHRTLRAVVEWSWDLLSKPERLLAERIAVFPSGVTPESAAGVCADGTEITEGEIPDLLASLVDKSLLQLASSDTVRYRMLETIREYGVERLDERGELASIRDAHARYFSDLTIEADSHLRRAEQLSWMRLLDAERDNVLSGARFLGDSGETTRAMRVVVAFAAFWLMVGNHADSTTWLEYVVGLTDDADPEGRDLRIMAEAALALNSTESAAGAFPSRSSLQAISDSLESLDDSVHPLASLLKQTVALFAELPDRMATSFAEGLKSSDPWVVASTRMLRAMVAENDGDVTTLRREAEKAIVGFRDLGERWGLASTLQALANARMLDGDLDGALTAADEAIGCMEEMGAHEDAVMLRLRRADIRLRMGDAAGALADADAARDLSEGIGSGLMSVFALVAMARIRQRMGEPTDIAKVTAEALERLQRIPNSHPVQGHATAMITTMIAANEIEHGTLDAADRHARDAYRTGLGTHDMPIMASVGVAVARLAQALGCGAAAAEMLGAAARLRGADDATDLHVREVTSAIVDDIGNAAFDTAYAKGRALDKDAALARIDPASIR